MYNALPSFSLPASDDSYRDMVNLTFAHDRKEDLNVSALDLTHIRKANLAAPLTNNWKQATLGFTWIFKPKSAVANRGHWFEDRLILNREACPLLRHSANQVQKLNTVALGFDESGTGIHENTVGLGVLHGRPTSERTLLVAP